MLLHIIWFVTIFASCLFAMITGKAEIILDSALQGTGEAIALTLRLLAGYLFFCGFMQIVNKLKIPEAISRVIKPVLRKLMPETRDEETQAAVTMNLSANLLGLGNAATPYGIEAAKRLETASEKNRHGLYMLLIINATSLQLLPTTVLTLRIAAGSAQPNAILLPTVLSTVASTAVGITLGVLCRKWQEVRHGA